MSATTNEPMSEYIQVLTTTEKQEDAQKIADALVENRLAACVQIIGPIASTYRWEGTVQRTEEYLCQIKTRRDRYAELESAIRKIHPYDVPEIIALPIVEGSRDYLTWIDDQLAPPKP